jgi:hypothetical protein
MTHRTTRRIVIGVACVVQVTVLAAQGGDAWYGRQGAKSKDFDGPKTFSGAFQIELPKDWQLVPGHTGTVFLVAEKKKGGPGAAIALEYMSLQAAVSPSVLPALGAQLLKDVQARELRGSNFTQQVITRSDRSLIMIHYDRPNLIGGQDHIVQYSIPVGTTMYHLICIAPRESIEKYRSTFAYTAASFSAAKPGT